jgi:hypothetical protein
MKNRLLVILFLFAMAFRPGYAADLDSVYRALDSAIKNKLIYDARREAKIATLKNLLQKAGRDYGRTFYLNDQLSETYKAYRYDSAAIYLNRNLDLAQKHNDIYRLDQTKLKLAYTFASAGMYLEAVNLIGMINRSKLSPDLVVDYYSACNHTYGEQGHYTQDRRTNQYYSRLAQNYKDSLMSVLPHGSQLYLSFRETDAWNIKKFDEALRLNSMQMKGVKPNTPEYSIVCYFRSVDYKGKGDVKMEKYWLGLSAICDVKQAVKDQASLWTLADMLAQEGDIERSYRYIRFSWDGTRFYNAPLRNLQSSGVLSMIDHNYQLMTEKQNTRLRDYLLLISGLTFLLIIAIGYVYVQMKHLAMARNNLHVANSHLIDLNARLKKTVQSLNKSNAQLLDSNKIKEVYIGRFLTLCSFYIDKLDSFRNTVIKKAKGGQLSDYLSSNKMQSLKEQDLTDLFRNFDHAFLCLVPNFIEEFNKLLKPEARMVPDKDELLNTELRLFALIRLGVEDSSKIAEFLHYSVNTIYNYRAKVKNASIISRDDFEKRVKEIGRGNIEKS